MTKINSLFTFVDPKDPFSAGEIAGEQLPGPILSIMSAKPFGHLFLFHTPHTRENAAATEKEVSSRYPECQIVVHELPVPDPKDYSSVMGHLARTIRRLMKLESSEIADRYVCVSSGTAEMRAAWFLLAALGILPANMLQVGSPARPLFGETNVKEVRMDSSDWLTIRDLAMPEEYFHGYPRELRTWGFLSSWLRRTRKRPDASSVPEEPKAGEETYGFEKALVERMRMLYGEPLTEVLLPLLCRKFMSRKLAPDNAQALTDETFRTLAGIFQREARPGHQRPRKARDPKHFAAFVNSICDGVLLEYYRASAKDPPPGEYVPPDSWGPTAEQLEAIRRQMQGLDRTAEQAQSEPGGQIQESLRSSRRLEGQELEEMDVARFLGEGRRVIPGLDDALLELGIFIGSAALRHAAEQAGIAAGSDLPVLLLGEAGTGKERFAHLIHRLSPRFHRGLVPVNCAAIPASLAESYLFGHTKGAFTGATSDAKGIFEAADQGTLFLDEISELTLEVQAKLLRVMQDFEVQRLGSAAEPRKVDVRIIAASNRDLRKEVSAGRFREDLYSRLAVVPIKLPALRERRSEIPELAVTLLRKINQRRQKRHQLTTRAVACLERQAWPGNVRDLLNVLERSVLYSFADVIDAEDLKFDCDPPAKDPFAALPEPSNGFKLDEYQAQVRNHLFMRALEKCRGNQTAAAELLGVTKQAVSKWLLGQTDNAN